MMEEKELLSTLRHCWIVTSVESHIHGFWELETESFDFQELKLEKDAVEGDWFLSKLNTQFIIGIKGNESYYTINEIEKGVLNLTSYHQSPQKEVGLIKLATFSLSIT